TTSEKRTPAVHSKADNPPASAHQFLSQLRCSRRAAGVRQIAQAENGWFPPFSRIFQLYQSGFDPTATMGFGRFRRELVMAQTNHRAVAIRLKQELHCRLAGLEALHSAPSEHDLAIGNHLQIGALDRNPDRAGDTK